MKKILMIVASAVAMAAMLSSCTKPETQDPFDWDKFNQGQGGDDNQGGGSDGPSALSKPVYKISAHRGGSSECGAPDNSRASLQYAISLGCAGSECDIYWTKDDDVIVAHADGNCQINGKYPWESTLKELQDAGALKNGEKLPSLGEYIDCLLENTKCTKLTLDIKNITVPTTISATTRAQYCINATRRACEIIKEKKAVDYVEFICTGNTTVMTSSFQYATAAGIPIGWMGNKPASTYSSSGYTWANLSIDYVYSNGEAHDRTIKEFVDKGIAISVYNVDKDIDFDYYVVYYDQLKYISTNYPSRLMGKLKAAGK